MAFRLARRFSTLKTPLPPALTPRSSPLSATVPPASVAGLSKAYRDYMLAVAAASPPGTVPATNRGVCLDSPGAMGPISALSDEVVSAMPPPPRPDHPDRERELTRKIPFSWAGGYVMALLAAYLFFKTRLKGSERCALELAAPWAARALERAGLVADLSPLRGGAALDVGALADRVFARFARECGGGSAAAAAAMPAARALRLLRALGLAAAEGEAAEGALFDAAALPRGAPLAAPQFRALFAAAARGAPPVAVYLLCGERLGVFAAPPAVLAALGGLFDRLVAARPSGAAFTAAALADIAVELGFVADEAAAAAFLEDAAAAAGGGAAAAGAPVLLSRADFVDFMAAAAAQGAGGLLEEGKVKDYIAVFSMLHLDGLREAAGVKPL
jgi:hypothetical protein